MVIKGCWGGCVFSFTINNNKNKIKNRIDPIHDHDGCHMHLCYPYSVHAAEENLSLSLEFLLWRLKDDDFIFVEEIEMTVSLIVVQ